MKPTILKALAWVWCAGFGVVALSWLFRIYGGITGPHRARYLEWPYRMGHEGALQYDLVWGVVFTVIAATPMILIHVFRSGKPQNP